MERSASLILLATALLICQSKPHGSAANDENFEDIPYGSVDYENFEDIYGEEGSGDSNEIDHEISDEMLGRGLYKDLIRGAVKGHSPIAANQKGYATKGDESHFTHPINYQPHAPHYQTPFPFAPPQGGFHPPPPFIPHHHAGGANQYSSDKYNKQNGDDLKAALEHLDYVKSLVADHAKYMEGNGCSHLPEAKSIYQPQNYKANSCDPRTWKQCSCMSPATYSDEGRGNCNLGATKADLKVWCYVDDKNGDPSRVCPDSKVSTSKPGYYWSNFACIT